MLEHVTGQSPVQRYHAHWYTLLKALSIWSWVIDVELFSQGFMIKSAVLASFSPAFMQLFVCIDMCKVSFIYTSTYYSHKSECIDA